MTSFRTWRTGDVENAIFVLLKQMLPNTKLKDFERLPREIREINPPRDGIAYACKYLMDIDGLRMSDIKIEQYWDKDGNCIGFEFQGKKHMFDKEILPEQEYDDVQDDGDFIKVKLNSDLARDMSHNPFGGDGKVYVVNPAVNGVSYVFPMRQVRSLAPKGSNGRVAVKSVWFDALCMYDASGRLIETQVTDKDFFDKWIVPPEMKLKKADNSASRMVSDATHHLVALRNPDDSIFAFHPVRLDGRTVVRNIGQMFNDARARIGISNGGDIPKDSELAKYLEQYPDAILTPDSKWGWITKLPEGSHPEARITAQRIKVWDKNGQYLSVIKGIQKEM